MCDVRHFILCAALNTLRVAIYLVCVALYIMCGTEYLVRGTLYNVWHFVLCVALV